jgi:hypothetical protein
MAAIADLLIRGVGNAQGRDRLRRDLSLQAGFKPRAIPIATAEVRPRGGISPGSRVVPVGLNIEDLGDEARVKHMLGRTDEMRPRLAVAMAGYVSWLAGHYADLRARLPLRFRELREEFSQVGAHARNPTQIAQLQLGLETWLEFTVEIGAMTREDADRWRDAGRELLVGSVEQEADDLSSETPIQRFLSYLDASFQRRRVYVESAQGGWPDEDADGWGWEAAGYDEVDLHDGKPPMRVAKYRHEPNAIPLGWIKDDWLLLQPDLAYETAVTAARAVGNGFSTDKRTLWEQLAKAGLIEVQIEKSTDPATGRVREKTRREILLRQGGRVSRVLKMRANFRDAMGGLVQKGVTSGYAVTDRVSDLEVGVDSDAGCGYKWLQVVTKEVSEETPLSPWGNTETPQPEDPISCNPVTTVTTEKQGAPMGGDIFPPVNGPLRREQSPRQRLRHLARAAGWPALELSGPDGTIARYAGAADWIKAARSLSNNQVSELIAQLDAGHKGE